MIVLPLTLSTGTTSTKTQSATAVAVRTSDNYRLGASKDALRGKEAPGLAVDPGNPNHIVEVQLDMLSGECQFNNSTDGGLTWTGDNLHAPSGYAQAGQTPCDVTSGTPMDSSVVFGSGQNVYTTWAVSSLTGPMNKATLVAKSSNGGATFAAAVVAMPEGAAPKVGTANLGPTYSAPKLAVQPGAGTGGADRIVVAAADNGCRVALCAGNLFVASSDDGGMTWSAPVQVNAALDSVTNPFGAGEVSQIVIGRNGHWYVAWRAKPVAFSSQNPTLADGFIRIGESSDAGKTWKSTDVTPVRGYVYSGPATPPYAKTPTAFGCCTFPRLAINLASGALYLVFNQGPGLYDPATGKLTAQDHFINPASGVWVMSSADGTTWTGRHQVNDSPVDGVATETRHPGISIAADGRIDVVWQDRRSWYRGCTATHVACTEARLGDTYYSYSTDGGKTFSPNRRITDRSMNNDVGFDYRYGTYWDFGPVSAPVGGGKVLIAWMDSREGNHTNDNQDIYLAQTPVTPSGSIPVKALQSATNPDLSVALSQLADPGGSEAVLASTFATRGATWVVVANDHDTAGILAGGVLARANLGPLLVSPASGLPANVKAEVTRMNPLGAYVIGGTGELSAQVETDLVSAGVPVDKVTRVDRGNPAGTASLIATQMDRRSDTDKAANVPAFDAVVIATAGSPEASSAGTLAANRRLPVLYVDKSGVPTATSDTLTALHINRALVIGGASVVSDTVVSQLTKAGVEAVRLGGADAEATSVAVIKESIKRGLPTNELFVANGDNPLQGALVGSSTARIGGLLLLTKGGAATDAPSTLRDLGIEPQVARIITASSTA